MRSAARREGWLLLLAAACLATAYAFAKFGSEVHEGELGTFDRVVRDWMVSRQSPVGTHIFRVVTQLGAKEVLAPLALLVGWLLFHDARRFIVLLVLAGPACAEFVARLKRDYSVERPAGGLEAGLGFSFPSGHSAGSMAVAILLSYVAVRRRIHPRLVITVSEIVVLLVGISRVYLDLHWPSDVLGGWLVGGAFGAACCAIYEWMNRRSKKAKRDLSAEP